jgi:predicted tellurium resistance membrane protein TerC
MKFETVIMYGFILVLLIAGTMNILGDINSGLTSTGVIIGFVTIIFALSLWFVGKNK